MMANKCIGSTCLVAGTAIGAGMMALPLTLIKIGLLPATLLMLIIWGIMYYSALVALELNLHAPQGLPLGELGALYSGPIAKTIGTISFMALTYALLSAYLYGGTSIIQKLIEHMMGTQIPFDPILMGYATCLCLLLAASVTYIERANRLLFMALLGGIALAIGFLAHYAHVPPLVEAQMNVSTWSIAVPVLFTSFGFQVIFHTLTNYCEGNASTLKRAFFWGSLIPALVYIVWTSGVVGTLYGAPDLYQQVLCQPIEVGTLIANLIAITANPIFQVLAWTISILVIVTSIVGVGLGLLDTWKHHLKGDHNHGIGVLLTVLPAMIVGLCVPNAFIKILGFAGLVLVIIAILMPLYLLAKARIPTEKLNYPILRHRWLQILVALSGLAIMACDVTNMIVG